MKINFTQVLKNFDGKPIKGAEDKDATLKYICVDVLLTEMRDENSPAADKIRRYELAKAIHNCEEMDLKAEDISLIKTRIGKVHFPLIVGITEDMLEGK